MTLTGIVPPIELRCSVSPAHSGPLFEAVAVQVWTVVSVTIVIVWQTVSLKLPELSVAAQQIVIDPCIVSIETTIINTGLSQKSIAVGGVNTGTAGN